MATTEDSLNPDDTEEGCCCRLNNGHPGYPYPITEALNVNLYGTDFVDAIDLGTLRFGNCEITQLGPQFSSVAQSYLAYLINHGLQHTRLPGRSPTPKACSNSCPSSPWCHPNISSSVVPFSSCRLSFPASGSFPWVSSLLRVAKVLELQLQYQFFQWIFRTDFP